MRLIAETARVTVVAMRVLAESLWEDKYRLWECIEEAMGVQSLSRSLQLVSGPLETLSRPLQSFSRPIQALSGLKIILFRPSNGRNKLSHGLHKHSQGLFKHSQGLKMPDIAFMLKSLYLIFFFWPNFWSYPLFFEFFLKFFHFFQKKSFKNTFLLFTYVLRYTVSSFILFMWLCWSNWHVLLARVQNVRILGYYSGKWLRVSQPTCSFRGSKGSKHHFIKKP